MHKEGSTMETDLLGTPLTPAESRLLHVYSALKSLSEEKDLPPCASANVRTALSSVAVAVTGLALEYEHLIDQQC